MAWKRSEHLEEMYQLYLEGNSLTQVAKVYGKTRQSVFGLFKYNGKSLRPKLAPLPFVEFNGNKYTMRNNGYLGRTNSERNMLHRDVWEFHNGPILEGWDIHHIDENRTNNEISNLECLPKSEHTRLYSPHNNQYTKGRGKK